MGLGIGLWISKLWISNSQEAGVFLVMANALARTLTLTLTLTRRG